MSIIEEQLADTPLGRQSRLYMLAVDVCAKSRGNAFAAQRRLADAIQNDLAAMRQLCGEDLRALLERKAHEFCRQVIKDQGGDALKREEGHEADASAGVSLPSPHSILAPGVKKNQEKIGQKSPADSRFKGADTSPEPVSSAKGQLGPASSAAPALPSAEENQSAGEAVVGLPSLAKAKVPQPADRFRPGNAKRGISVIAELKKPLEKSLLDTYKVRDGRVVGDLLLLDLPSLRAANVKEAALLQKLMRHVANADPDQKVRDVVSHEHFLRLLAEAEEISRAA